MEKRLRVLVVEGNPLLAQMLNQQLCSLGFKESALARSGEEAVAKAVSLQPDLLLVDIEQEDGMDGIAAVEMICLYREVPVVYLANYLDALTAVRAYRTPLVEILPTVVSDRELADSLFRALAVNKKARQRQPVCDQPLQ